MTVVFRTELLRDVRAEAMPLLRQHWEEIALNRDRVPLDPDWEMYDLIERAGRFHVTTARRDGSLVGYASYFVGQNLHYRSLHQAESDIFFLGRPERRGLCAMRMLDAAEASLRARGVNKFIYRTKDHFDLGPLLLRRGCVLIEHVYARLDA